MRGALLGLLCSAIPALAASTALAAEPQLLNRPNAQSRLTVEEVINLALARHPELASSRARAEAARDHARSVRGRMLPSIHLSDELQHWDSVFSVAFSSPGMSFPAVKARDQDTNTLVASASQPLLGLLHRMEDYRAESDTAEAAEVGVQVAQAALREAIQIGYLRMFEAQAVEQIAVSSMEELGEQVGVIEAKLKAGTLTNADLLRVKVAISNARQQGIAAHAQWLGARASLLAAIGLAPDDATVEFLEPASLLGPAVAAAGEVGAEIDQGLKQRPELTVARLSAESALRKRSAHTLSLLPELDLEGAFLRVDGQVFQPPNSGFVGLKLEWAIWEWGASWYARQAASELADAAQAEVENQERQVRVEIVSRRAQLDASHGAVTLARETIASAEEAFRVTDALVRAGSATTTDLLDAQSSLAQARLNLSRALYEEAVARVSLARAVGADQAR